MNPLRRRIADLISTSSLYEQGCQDERQHIKTLLKVRMDELHHNSVAWQECRNLLSYLQENETPSA
jgi:hypothetical protein